MAELYESFSKPFIILACLFNVVMFCLEIYTVIYLWPFTNWLTLLGLLWGMGLATERHVININKLLQTFKTIS